MNKLKAIICMLMLLCIGYSIKITSAYLQQKERATTLNQTINDLNQEIETYEVRLNDSIVVHAARVADLNMTIDNIEHYYKDLLKANTIKPKDVSHVTTTETSTQGVEIVPVYVDTFGGMKASYIDPYTSIVVDIDSTRQAVIDYSIKDSLTIINYQKKRSILWGLIKWKKPSRTVVVSANPKTTIVNVTSVNNFEK